MSKLENVFEELGKLKRYAEIIKSPEEFFRHMQGHTTELSFVLSAFGIVEIAEDIIKGLNEEKVDRWIPVSDRLPNNKEKVLIQTSSGRISIGFCNINYSDWREEGYMIASPVAWKPLPTPYKEVQK